MGSCDVVVSVQAAERPSATVVEDDHRQVLLRRGRWPVDPHRDVLMLPITDAPVLDSQIGQQLGRRLQRGQACSGHLDAVGRGKGHRHCVEQHLQ
ncbi:hypothetical protein A9W94_03425 [Mycobacterium asiaticum]|nr:hypothetical protein A9W94_03425 [Mycobacterium asiaticum]